MTNFEKGSQILQQRLHIERNLFFAVLRKRSRDLNTAPHDCIAEQKLETIEVCQETEMGVGFRFGLAFLSKPTLDNHVTT